MAARGAGTGISFRVDGVPELERALNRAGFAMSDLDMGPISRQTQALAAGFAPRRTGTLASSIRASVTRNRASVRSALVYAAPINYGWRRRNIAPTHYLQKADSIMRRVAPMQLEAQTRKIIGRYT